jgi:hypothetical protein
MFKLRVISLEYHRLLNGDKLGARGFLTLNKKESWLNGSAPDCDAVVPVSNPAPPWPRLTQS